MSESFSTVIKNFWVQEYQNLPQYNKICYNLQFQKNIIEKTNLYAKAFNQIFVAALYNNSNAKKIILDLYKKYYKREYNQLKRYSVFEPKCLLDFGENYDDTDFARLLIIASFLGSLNIQDLSPQLLLTFEDLELHTLNKLKKEIKIFSPDDSTCNWICNVSEKINLDSLGVTTNNVSKFLHLVAQEAGFYYSSQILSHHFQNIKNDIPSILLSLDKLFTREEVESMDITPYFLSYLIFKIMILNINETEKLFDTLIQLDQPLSESACSRLPSIDHNPLQKPQIEEFSTDFTKESEDLTILKQQNRALKVDNINLHDSLKVANNKINILTEENDRIKDIEWQLKILKMHYIVKLCLYPPFPIKAFSSNRLKKN